MLRHSLLALALLAAHGLPTPYKHKQRELEPPPDHERTSLRPDQQLGSSCADRSAPSRSSRPMRWTSRSRCRSQRRSTGTSASRSWRRPRKSRRRTTRAPEVNRPGQGWRLQVGIQAAHLPSGVQKCLATTPLRGQRLRRLGGRRHLGVAARTAAADAEHRQPRANNRRVYRLMTMPEIYGAYFAAVDAKKNNLMEGGQTPKSIRQPADRIFKPRGESVVSRL